MTDKELEKIRKKYNELKEKTTNNTDIKTDDELLIEAVLKTKINSKSNLYIYVRTFMKNDKDSYKLYRNLELKYGQVDYEVAVPIKKCKGFEEDNLVIYLNDKFDDELYLKLKGEYFKSALEEGKQKATCKLLIKYSDNKK